MSNGQGGLLSLDRGSDFRSRFMVHGTAILRALSRGAVESDLCLRAHLGPGGEWTVAVRGGGSETREESIAESGHERLVAPTGVWSRRWTAVGHLGHALGQDLISRRERN